MSDTNKTNKPLLYDVKKETNFLNYINIAGINNNIRKIYLGVLPGYNENIDTTTYDFEKDLLHNFTFTDLSPVTYDLKMLQTFYKIFNGASSEDFSSGKIFNSAGKILLSPDDKSHWTGSLYEYNQTNTNSVNTYFTQALNNYFGSAFNAKNIHALRLIGSQDSVFSETIQNRFGDNNIINQLNPAGIAGAMLQSLGKKGNVLQSAAGALKNIPKYNYDAGLNLMKKMSTDISLLSLMESQLFGMQISLPRVFENSSYVDSLTLFLRLTSPTGNPKDIRTFILTPLIILMTAAAPISFDGISYGFPPLWQIKSYGNTHQTVGVIDVITITRGSMETTYSDKLEPLSIDVRLTLTSLSHHYATLIRDDISMESLLDENGVGMTTVANVSEAILNTNERIEKFELNI